MAPERATCSKGIVPEKAVPEPSGLFEGRKVAGTFMNRSLTMACSSFRRDALEGLRQPMEEGQVAVAPAPGRSWRQRA